MRAHLPLVTGFETSPVCVDVPHVKVHRHKHPNFGLGNSVTKEKKAPPLYLAPDSLAMVRPAVLIQLSSGRARARRRSSLAGHRVRANLCLSRWLSCDGALTHTFVRVVYWSNSVTKKHAGSHTNLAPGPISLRHGPAWC
jgi:hypothetical protein